MARRRGRQLALFPRGPRANPAAISPEGFESHPGVMWHGNYDPESVTLSLDTEMGRFFGVVAGGVHAGTQRSAMDRLDAQGPYDYLKDRASYGRWDSEDEAAAIDARGGVHGYIHPVIPQQDRMAPGLYHDEGSDWTDALRKANAASLRAPDEPSGWHVFDADDVQRGVRYRNAEEHIDSISALLPNTSLMQHSDYVQDALERGDPVHPRTLAMYELGVLDREHANKYEPLDDAYYGSDLKAKQRRERWRFRRRQRHNVGQQLDLFVD